MELRGQLRSQMEFGNERGFTRRLGDTEGEFCGGAVAWAMKLGMRYD